MTAAELKHGAIADWDVSGITDMSRLFSDLGNFNADISSWDTSSVTDMSRMFEVRFRLRRLPPLPSWATHARRVCAADSPFPLCHISVPRASLCRVPTLDSAGCRCFQPTPEL